MSSPGIAQLPARQSPVTHGREPRSSSDILGALGPRWTRVDGVPFGSTVDVAHVLLADAGVLVVEIARPTTAWPSSKPELEHTISETRWRARKIEFLLDEVVRLPVTPVVIVSGPGTPDIAGGYEMIDGVLVARAADATRVTAYLEGLPSTLEPGLIPAMLDILIDHTLRTEEHHHAPAGRHVTPST